MSTSQLPERSHDNHDTARPVFMLKLVDTLHSMPDASAIEEAACRLLVEYLHAGRACIAVISPDRQSSSIRNEYVRERCTGPTGARSAFYPPSLARIMQLGQPFILDDSTISEALSPAERTFCVTNQVRSCIGFPVGNGTPAPTYIVVSEAVPRRWTANELSLVHETATRTGYAIHGVNAAGRQRDLNTALQKKSEQQTADLLRLRNERACLLQMLDAQVDRLHKLMRDLHDGRRIAEPAAAPANGRPDRPGG